MTVPIIHQKGDEADKAWREHSALLKAVKEAPSLSQRPEFQALRLDAYERFHNAFEVK